jgi:hypothetical protein
MLGREKITFKTHPGKSSVLVILFMNGEHVTWARVAISRSVVQEQEDDNPQDNS